MHVCFGRRVPRICNLSPGRHTAKSKSIPTRRKRILNVIEKALYYNYHRLKLQTQLGFVSSWHGQCATLQANCDHKGTISHRGRIPTHLVVVSLCFESDLLNFAFFASTLQFFFFLLDLHFLCGGCLTTTLAPRELA